MYKYESGYIHILYYHISDPRIILNIERIKDREGFSTLRYFSLNSEEKIGLMFFSKNLECVFSKWNE